MNYWTNSKDNIFVAAHRGWLQLYPENTMEAFRAAAALGVDQIETDIHMTKDGELVIIHDHKLDRTTNGTGLVKEYTLAELKQLDAGSHKGIQFRNARIPTLRELFDLVKEYPALTLDLELKDYPTEGQEAFAYESCDKVIAMIEEYGFGDRLVLNSWSGTLNEYIFKKYGKRYRQHVYYPQRHLQGEYEIDPYTYAFCACMFDDEGTGSFISSVKACEEMAAKGVEPWAGAGTKCGADVDKVIAAGCTLITCNNPDVILDELRARGKHK